MTTFIHTLLGAQPPARTDEVAWNRVRIEHSATEDGSWSLDELRTLSPVDSNPREPAKRDFTFASAASEAFFRLTFLDPEDSESVPTDPVFDDGSGVTIRPRVAEVAALLRARTYEDEGEQEGEFNEKTRPTLAQVEGLIGQAITEVTGQLATDLTDERMIAFARSIVAIRAAMSIELSYFPEQADEDETTVYRELKSLYDERLKILLGSLPDSNATQFGMYSLRMRSDFGGLLSTAEQLP